MLPWKIKKRGLGFSAFIHCAVLLVVSLRGISSGRTESRFLVSSLPLKSQSPLVAPEFRLHSIARLR